MPRKDLLEALANSMMVPQERRTALLGRFQHLQRLALVEGVNPGRGKAATYDAGQVYIVGVAFQLLQVGLNPERAVSLIRDNMRALASSVDLIDAGVGAYITFDPAVFTPMLHDTSDDFATTSFVIVSRDSLSAVLDAYFGQANGELPRLVIISLSGLVDSLLHWMDPIPKSSKVYPHVGPLGSTFMADLRQFKVRQFASS